MSDDGGPLGTTHADGDLASGADVAGFEALLDYLHRSRGFDFTGYKRTTLSRRIHRRMQTVGVARYGAYIDHLEVRPDEFPALFNTILINVTAFFRDRAAWETIRTLVASRLEVRDPGTAFRVWCAGCASGEEAYTLAILLAEILGPKQYADRVRIYATDIDDDALAQARLATYALQALEGVPEALRDKYFTRVGVRFQLNKDVRRGVIFGRHDLVQDAPISQIDLLTCRNALMYFNADAQTRILKRLHFALNDSGILFLGRAEMLLTHANLFSPLEMKLRIFERTRGRLRDRLLAQDSPRVAEDVAADDRVRLNRAAFHLREVEQRLENGVRSQLDIEITPLLGDSCGVIGTELSFAEVTETHRMQAQLRTAHAALERAHEQLQSTGEELETTNEELQATVEELETTNEELQSINVELEAMNQELQATNAELQAMNGALRRRGEDIAEVSDFMTGILGSMRVGVAVLDRKLLVRAWNERMEELWGLRADEVQGKYFITLDIGLPVDQVTQAVRGCLAGGEEIARTLDCVNRRGRTIRCHVTVTPVRSLPIRAVTVVVEELAAS